MLLSYFEVEVVGICIVGFGVDGMMPFHLIYLLWHGWGFDGVSFVLIFPATLDYLHLFFGEDSERVYFSKRWRKKG